MDTLSGTGRDRTGHPLRVVSRYVPVHVGTNVPLCPGVSRYLVSPSNVPLHTQDERKYTEIVQPSRRNTLFDCGLHGYVSETRISTHPSYEWFYTDCGCQLRCQIEGRSGESGEKQRYFRRSVRIARPVTAEMRHRHRPRKPRNCYRDAIWIRAVLRQWRNRLRLPDLDAAFIAAMEDDRL